MKAPQIKAPFVCKGWAVIDRKTGWLLTTVFRHKDSAEELRRRNCLDGEVARVVCTEAPGRLGPNRGG